MSDKGGHTHTYMAEQVIWSKYNTKKGWFLLHIVLKRIDFIIYYCISDGVLANMCSTTTGLEFHAQILGPGVEPNLYLALLGSSLCLKWVGLPW